MEYVFFLSLYIAKILKQKAGGYDVLNAHKQRNRSLRAPQVASLASAASEQSRMASISITGSVDGADNSGNEDQPVQTSHKRIVTKVIKPTTLAYWPGGWRLVLTRAKAEFEYYIAAIKLFPTKSKNLRDVELIIKRQMVMVVEEGIALDHRNFSFIERDLTMYTNDLFFQSTNTPERWIIL